MLVGALRSASEVLLRMALRLHEVGMIKSTQRDHRRGHRLALPEELKRELTT